MSKRVSERVEECFCSLHNRNTPITILQECERVNACICSGIAKRMTKIFRPYNKHTLMQLLKKKSQIPKNPSNHNACAGVSVSVSGDGVCLRVRVCCMRECANSTNVLS